MLSQLSALLPSQCAICRSWPGPLLCQPCRQRFATARARCPHCALAWSATADMPTCPQCQGQALPLQACFAAVDYGYPWAELLGDYKFRRRTGLSSLFAQLLLQTPGVRECLTGLGPQDLVLPLPLSTQRLAERGFNQAWELAQALHKRSLCPARLSARVLLRLRHTQAQSELPRSQRLSNVRGAFWIEPEHGHFVRGRQVVLIDDVMTSGASLSAAALTLLEAGALGIQAMVVARTPP
ncbi:MAG: ComF family protein [Betaproteobacteria bacterium]